MLKNFCSSPCSTFDVIDLLNRFVKQLAEWEPAALIWLTVDGIMRGRLL